MSSEVKSSKRKGGIERLYEMCKLPRIMFVIVAFITAHEYFTMRKMASGGSVHDDACVIRNVTVVVIIAGLPVP